MTTDTFDGKVPVEPPYTLTLATPGVDPPTAIGFTGTGWTTVDITQISPDGVVVDTFAGTVLTIGASSSPSTDLGSGRSG